MLRKLVTGFILTAFLLMSGGCSQNFNLTKINPLAKLDLFKKQTETTAPKDGEVQKPPVKPRPEAAREINVMVDSMVRDIHSGKWNKAIQTGEQAFVIAAMPEYNSKETVNTAAYDPYGLEAAKEKLYEVLTDAYDYKLHLEGLTPEEKEKHVRVARAHMNINPSDIFKKHAMAKVLIDTGNITEGLVLANEAYNTNNANSDFLETYAWGIYLSGKKAEAYNLYKTYIALLQVASLNQIYHSAVVIEEQDKLFGLTVYKGCEYAGNNLMVLEPNVNNISAQSYINKIITDSQKAVDRLLAGGLGVDSQFNYEASERLINSVVKL